MPFRPICSLILLSSALGIAPPCGLRTATAEPPVVAETPQFIVKKAISLLERGAKEYPEHRQCFACHHQTLPLLAHREAERLKIERKPEFEASTLEFVDASFRGKIADLNAGEGIGGKGLTVGYGLWTFRLGNHPADDLTRAMVTYLLKTQAEDGHWGLHSIRPPSEESVAFATVLAAAGVAQFADESQHADRDRAVEKARNWLRTAERPLHEDRVAHAWGWKLLGGSEEERDAARTALFESQQPDGGWRQTDELPSDAYASGTAVYALMETGVSSDHPAIRRGVEFLSRTQKPDGSWHVATRAKPVQVFFDNGDPHGKDQFISLMATGWAAAAIARGTTADPVPGQSHNARSP